MHEMANLFSRKKNKKNISTCRLLKILPRMISVQCSFCKTGYFPYLNRKFETRRHHAISFYSYKNNVTTLCHHHNLSRHIYIYHPSTVLLVFHYVVDKMSSEVFVLSPTCFLPFRKVFLNFLYLTWLLQHLTYHQWVLQKQETK